MINPPKIACAPKPAAKRVTLKFPDNSELEPVEKKLADKVATDKGLVAAADTMEIPVTTVKDYAIPTILKKESVTVNSVKSEQGKINPVSS